MPKWPYQFAAAAPEALACLDPAAAEAGFIAAMDAYDRDGLYRASALFKNVSEFTSASRQTAAAVAFEDVAQNTAAIHLRLAGRRLRLDTAVRSYTDTETLYLRHASPCSRHGEETSLFTGNGTLLWAQGCFGTFNVDLDAACSAYADPGRALELLNTLETSGSKPVSHARCRDSRVKCGNFATASR